ncbi:MAG: aminotransferase class I/II-fold pyridoxal phosphate-dependent enzyme, partial [Flavobacteriales bacterium]|nr:aminotransferase class I/II-fold pyridoxal phosphate-dependent enzyme [Flavobacteriales bacterium]
MPFSPPRIDEASIAEVVDTLKSGWITTGPKTKEFERKISEYCGARKTICLNSGTAAMQMMLYWYGVGPGDEVIIPAYTYCATANIVEHCKATIKMVDVNREEFNISVKAVRNAITEKTKVIIPVDIGGLPCDYDALMELVNEDAIKEQFAAKNQHQKKLGRILVLADAAHSFGASYKGRQSGVLADASAFSFHAVKNLTTAEGGALVLNLPEAFDVEEIYAYMNTMSLHG